MVGTGIWRETLKKGENEKYDLQDLEYGQKMEETWKMRHSHSRTWNSDFKKISKIDEN